MVEQWVLGAATREAPTVQLVRKPDLGNPLTGIDR
jgi:hypothetical protein